MPQTVALDCAKRQRNRREHAIAADEMRQRQCHAFAIRNARYAGTDGQDGPPVVEEQPPPATEPGGGDRAFWSEVGVTIWLGLRAQQALAK